MEARSEADSMGMNIKLRDKNQLQVLTSVALLSLPNFFPRSNQHWKCENRWSTERPSYDGWPIQCSAITLFHSYSLSEPLTNVLLKRLRPSIFLPAIMILWGIIMATMGLVHDFQGLAAAVCSHVAKLHADPFAKLS